MSKSFFKIGKLGGKGAAAVICLCLAAVAGAGVYTYNKSELTEEKLSASDDAVHSDDYLNADAAQNDVPKNDGIAVEAPVESAMEESGNGAEEANEADENDAVNPPVTEAEKSPFEEENALSSGILVRPADGDIICGYSNGELVKSKTLEVWKTHDGIDIAVTAGDPIRAVAAGTVTAVYTDPMWGNCISIEHSGGYESFYMGVSDTIEVAQNENVRAGEEIAEAGNTADGESAEDDHLHFALKKNGKWIDPADALSGLGS